jgi:hypothetical protein
VLPPISEQLKDAEHLRYVLEEVEKEIAKLRLTLPGDDQEAELAAEQRRLDNFIEFIGEAGAARRCPTPSLTPSGASKVFRKM